MKETKGRKGKRKKTAEQMFGGASSQSRTRAESGREARLGVRKKKKRQSTDTQMAGTAPMQPQTQPQMPRLTQQPLSMGPVLAMPATVPVSGAFGAPGLPQFSTMPFGMPALGAMPFGSALQSGVTKGLSTLLQQNSATTSAQQTSAPHPSFSSTTNPHT